MKDNLDKNAQKFANLMISKMNSISENWKQPWFSKMASSSRFLPQNISGRTYASGNAFLLFFLTEQQNFRTPVFLTFKQAKELKVSILKGSESFPVYYTAIAALHLESKDKITIEKYRELDDEEKKEYRILVSTKYYLVFNLDQTNFAEIHPNRWESIQEKFHPIIDESVLEDKEMYCNPILDNLQKQQSWVCPILLKNNSQAFYSPSEDKIQLPLKKQFVDGESFYSTQLHEMAHSTGISSRCARTDFKSRDTDVYGREELVAEFSAALAGVVLGISLEIREENAAYLKVWINKIKEEPKFLMTVLSDSVKVVKYIADKLNLTLLKVVEEAAEEAIAA